MAANKLTDEQLAELVKQFQALKTHAERVKFIQDNNEITRVINAVHFAPEPGQKPIIQTES